MTGRSRLSPVQLGVIWQRLSGVMDEVAQTFVRTSFSVVVRENWDFACSFMDREGRQFAQSSRSVPSFIGTMPGTLRAMLERHPVGSLQPGDVLRQEVSLFGSELLFVRMADSEAASLKTKERIRRFP